MELLQEMLSTSNPLQHGAIQHMVAFMYSQKGMLCLHRDHYRVEEAYTHFKRALDISVELSKASGEHILVTPLTLCANVLSTLERHGEALGMYERAIRLSELHIGPLHESLGTLLVNFGISLVQSGKHAQAVGVLERALSVMDANDPQRQHRGRVGYTRGLEFLQQAKEGAKGKSSGKNKKTKSKQ